MVSPVDSCKKGLESFKNEMDQNPLLYTQEEYNTKLQECVDKGERVNGVPRWEVGGAYTLGSTGNENLAGGGLVVSVAPIRLSGQETALFGRISLTMLKREGPAEGADIIQVPLSVGLWQALIPQSLYYEVAATVTSDGKAAYAESGFTAYLPHDDLMGLGIGLNLIFGYADQEPLGGVILALKVGQF